MDSRDEGTPPRVPPPDAFSWRHFTIVLASTVVVAIPAILVDPAVLHFITGHPAVAAYYPVVLAVVSTVARAYKYRDRE